MFGDVHNRQGEQIDYTVHEGGSEGLVVVGHGVTGNKDRPFVVALAKALAEAGITALRLSFSGNGDSAGRFEDSTISKEVADLGSLLDAVGDRPVCFVGHSMGGAVGVLRSASDRRIHWLVSLAGMVHTRAFAEREFGEETPDAGCMWEEESCPLSSAYMDDMDDIDSVVDSGAAVTVPWLLVHGTADDVVPLQDSRDIADRASQARLVELAGADHVFSDDAIVPMIRTVVPWVVKQVGRQR
ncbi:MAG: alpha/beta hydrolase [Gemmatimonadaceae bacterium]|nr:alpha/beta hydrolase [Gemmatimonadaceae bacterium]